jgi:hypothetical protein
MAMVSSMGTSDEAPPASEAARHWLQRAERLRRGSISNHADSPQGPIIICKATGAVVPCEVAGGTI